LAALLLVVITAPSAWAQTGAVEAQDLFWSGSRTRVSSFERSFNGWRPDHFILCEHEDPPCTFNWSITRSTDQAKHGSFSLKGFLDGTNDDGTIWVERPFFFLPGSEVTVDLSFWLWSSQQSDFNNWPVVAFAGSKNPEIEDDFTVVGQTDVAPGWTQYAHKATVKAGPSGLVWVAFGFGATFETARTHYLDLAEVTFHETPFWLQPEWSPEQWWSWARGL
jgi:hypothetical protein